MNLKLICTLLASVSLIAPHLQADDNPEKWVSLFDGKTLNGWKQRGGVAKYTVEDGVIVGTTAPKTPNSFLTTVKNYGDFILELEFKVDPRMNSGIQIRSNEFKEGDKQVEGRMRDIKPGKVHGYQVEIDPSDRAWSGGIYDEARRGWLNDLKDKPAARFAFKQDQWNHYRIEAIGDRIRTWVNGAPAADLKDNMTATGFIGLQVHNIRTGDGPWQVRWRNIRIQENPSPSAEIKTPKTSSGPIVAENSKVQILADGFKFTEGPAQGPNGKIYFTDIPNERIMVFDPSTKKTTVYREDSGKANGLWWTPADALLACEGGKRQLTRTDSSGKMLVLADQFEGKKLNSPNDLVQDQFGGIYFSDPRYGKRDDMEMDIEGVYYFSRRGKLTRVIADLKRPNGVLLSNDHKTLYVADTELKKIFSYTVTDEGVIADKQEFAQIGSDGLSMDERGNLYATWDGKIHILSPEGKELAQIECPQAPANCLLGGPNGNTLYITARKGFYSIDLNVKAPAPYNGKK